jgi:membrane protease YdiL (CAAX protease family)
MEEQPIAPLPEAPPPPLPPVERRPFWGYPDVMIFIGLFLASAMASLFLGTALLSRLHLPKGLSELAVQSLIYVLAFWGLALLFRIHYQRPFWRSLGWERMCGNPILIAAAGLGTAFVVALIGGLVRTPNTDNPITQMLDDPRSRVFVVLFAVTLAPVAEELIFRGFLQPLLMRTLGTVGGILAAALPFGLLHFQEYGNEWRHALLVALAGAAFGWMRHRSGSTKASSLMHASYNALELFAYFAQKELTH